MAAVNPSRSPCGDTSGLPSLAITALADIRICYRLARPVPEIGILLPGFAAALLAISMSWLLLSGPVELPYRPPVEFVAGVLGPLVGADLGETGGNGGFVAARCAEEALPAFYSP
jgi:uncharacterized membrane protein